MYIFRLEDKDGVGPYRSNKIGNLLSHWSYDHSGIQTEYRNAFNVDINCNDYLLYNCATRSLEEFLFWFPSHYLLELSGLGNDLVIFKVNKSKVIFGKKQILFRKDDVKEIKRIIPMDYEIIREYEARN